jgi:hypothetical protein
MELPPRKKQARRRSPPQGKSVLELMEENVFARDEQANLEAKKADEDLKRQMENRDKYASEVEKLMKPVQEELQRAKVTQQYAGITPALEKAKRGINALRLQFGVPHLFQLPASFYTIQNEIFELVRIQARKLKLEEELMSAKEEAEVREREIVARLENTINEASQSLRLFKQIVPAELDTITTDDIAPPKMRTATRLFRAPR